jgi:hypothetical protein
VGELESHNIGEALITVEAGQWYLEICYSNFSILEYV